MYNSISESIPPILVLLFSFMAILLFIYYGSSFWFYLFGLLAILSAFYFIKATSSNKIATPVKARSVKNKRKKMV